MRTASVLSRLPPPLVFVLLVACGEAPIPTSAVEGSGVAQRNEESDDSITIGVTMIDADDVWNQYGGDEVHVGIIDFGYDRYHEDLSYIYSSHCLNANACASSGHGIYVAGILAAPDNGKGVVGVAPRVMEDMWMCEADAGEYADLEYCIDQLVSKGVKVINMSFGGPNAFSQSVQNAILDADAADVLLLAEANNLNEGQSPWATMYPASYDSVKGVSGVMPDGKFAHPDSSSMGRAWYLARCPTQGIPAEWGEVSGSGDYVDIAAPFYTYTTQTNDTYRDVCGTSFSTPHVAGVAALIWDKNPTLSADEVWDIIASSATDGGVPGRDDYYGHGIVNAAAAIAATPLPPTPVSVILQGPDEAPPYAYEQCHWNAIASGGSGNFTYAWHYDGQWVGNDNTWGGNTGAPGTHYLRVTVTDNVYPSLSDWDDIFIEVDWSVWDCFA